MYKLSEVASACRDQIPGLYSRCNISFTKDKSEYALFIIMTIPGFDRFALALYEDEHGRVLLSDMGLIGIAHPFILNSSRDNPKLSNKTPGYIIMNRSCGTHFRVGAINDLDIVINNILDIPKAVKEFNMMVTGIYQSINYAGQLG